MKRTFLIDSENVNDIWVELLQCLDEKDEILVFYTDKSAHMGYERIVRLMEQKKGSIRWIRCFEGQNALDFQLVTELGSCISQEPKREYTIVSNDTGYDAVVRYWQQKDCRVRRMKGAECETLSGAEDGAAEKGEPEDRQEKCEAQDTCCVQETGTVKAVDQPQEKAQPQATTQPKETAQPQETAQPHAITQPQAEKTLQKPDVSQKERNTVPETEKEAGSDTAASWQDELQRVFAGAGSEDVESDMEFLTELCKTVKLSNMSLMHNVLEYHFGQEAGNAVYHFIKENPGCRGELSAGYSNNKKQRERKYLALILKRNHIVAEDGDEEAILKILGGIPRKNLNSIHAALVKKFGQEEGGNCYAVLRNHVKIIRGL